MSSETASTHRTREWRIPAVLLALTFVPAANGVLRLADLAGPASVESARFHASPIPIAAHAIGGIVFCGLGAFQFMPSLRLRHPRYHRIAGRIVLTAGLAMALSALWMTQVYDIVPEQSPQVYAVRMLVGAATTVGLVLALAAILRRDVPAHRSWMLRSYALGLGAATQSLIGLPVAAVVGLDQLLAPAVHVTVLSAGWGINALVAEWIVRRRPRGAPEVVPVP
ncbi:DUF2306 domain-containing protein [Pseudonocardia spirodelae]|uniref:DUF2306 domain-containing protein n=1 Tax=Pseudonocardia spirodelae TaxID=3133431 RepID=A0ABU8T9N9_9PSEU